MIVLGTMKLFLQHVRRWDASMLYTLMPVEVSTQTIPCLRCFWGGGGGVYRDTISGEMKMGGYISGSDDDAAEEVCKKRRTWVLKLRCSAEPSIYHL